MDKQIFEFIIGLASQYKLLDWLGIFLAQYLAYILVIAFIVLVLLEKKWKQRCYDLFLGLMSVLLARGLVAEVIKFLYQRPRPYVELVFKPLIDIDFSSAFPSGHASLFFALATTTFLINKKWSYYFFAGAFLMGLARIYVGVHWPLDILGGMVVGVLSALVVWKILPRSN